MLTAASTAWLMTVPLWIAFFYGQQGVSRARLQRFADRQRLAVTAEGGQLVMRYLAATRRWRAMGLAAGLAVTLPFWRGESLYLFAGWFVGAVIAEAWVVPLRHGATRLALVARRRLGDYLPRPARWLVGAVTMMSVAVGALTSTWWWAAASVVVTAVVWLTQQRILHRPQPAAPPDVLAADDAIRSRSLHVLTGAGTALILYCLSVQLWETPLALLSVVGLALIPALGYSMATATWKVVRAH